VEGGGALAASPTVAEVERRSIGRRQGPQGEEHGAGREGAGREGVAARRRRAAHRERAADPVPLGAEPLKRSAAAWAERPGTGGRGRGGAPDVVEEVGLAHVHEAHVPQHLAADGVAVRRGRAALCHWGPRPAPRDPAQRDVQRRALARHRELVRRQQLLHRLARQR
jgi:hypothetical protein